MKLLTAAFVVVLCTRGYAATVIDEPVSNVGSEQISVIPFPTALSDSETTAENSNISLVSLSIDTASETASSQTAVIGGTSIGSLTGTNDNIQGLLTHSLCDNYNTVNYTNNYNTVNYTNNHNTVNYTNNYNTVNYTNNYIASDSHNKNQTYCC
ncbi:hypothetical protein LPJ69_001090 [Coemansia sp. RSA 1752]|nr:hypothetical protein LPJ69_001090 [Coemansia sp. RSA 1752]